jgi:hypothetical protein
VLTSSPVFIFRFLSLHLFKTLTPIEKLLGFSMMMFDVNDAGAPLQMQDKQELMHKGKRWMLLYACTYLTRLLRDPRFCGAAAESLEQMSKNDEQVPIRLLETVSQGDKPFQIRQSAVIYFKRFILQNWDVSKWNLPKVIPRQHQLIWHTSPTCLRFWFAGRARNNIDAKRRNL